MASVVDPPSPVRPSLRERERVAEALRRACVDERISVDTLVGRVEAAYSARTCSELGSVVADLRRRRTGTAFLLRTVTSLSDLWAGMRWAWVRAQIPALALPLREEIVVGRGRTADCVLSDSSVSRRHATIRRLDAGWWLRDLGSLNGTYVNGIRILDEVQVAPGDDVTFGGETYRLARPGV